MKVLSFIKHHRNLIVFTFLLINLSFTSSINWELRKSSKDIFVYTRQGLVSDIKEVKCVTNFQSNLKNLVYFIKDISAHPQYIYKCKMSYILKNVNDSELYYYHETAAPWPVANRYGVIYYKITQNSQTKVVTIKSNGVLGMYPNQSNMVEVSALTASWTFTPKSDGTVDGEYYIYLNPGGQIPSWLINLFVVDGPYSTITKMKEMLQKEKYNHCKLNFIKN